MTSPVISFELPADDPERAQAFYDQAFGWRITELPGSPFCTLATASGTGGIDGIMAPRADDGGTTVIVIRVPDITEALARVDALGATAVSAATKVGDLGYSAHFTDTEGNVVGLWQNGR